jgi:cytoskeletal protein CcmA (bactofilin family)
MANSKEKQSAPIEVVPTNNVIMLGMQVDGDIHSDMDIIVRGVLHGNLTCKAKAMIAKTGVVEGNIQAKEVVVLGLVKGNLHSSMHTLITETGTIRGKVNTKKLIVEEGAAFGKIEFS